MAFLDETGLGGYTLKVKGMIALIREMITSHTTDYGNPHGITKSTVGLENVENKSSADIRSEITSEDVVNALGYNPSDATNYEPAGEDFGVIKSGGDLTITDGVATVNNNSHEHTIENIDGLTDILNEKVNDSVVDSKVSTHNTSNSSHNDIRLLISDLSAKLNNFLDVDDATKDQLSEVITLIENNKGTLESLTTSKINTSDIVNNLTTSSTSKVLSANVGVVIKGLIDALEIELNDHIHDISDVSNLQNILDKKALSSDLTSHTSNTTSHITSAERGNWNLAKTHADSSHAPSDAERNTMVGIQVNGNDVPIPTNRKVNLAFSVGSDGNLYLNY